MGGDRAPDPDGSPDLVTTRVLLVRHGEAVCNVDGLVGGLRGCTGLTAVGAAQVRALADRLACSAELGTVDALYASRLPRAIETAQILASRLVGRAGERLAVSADCSLCELHPGEADGLSWAELAARFDAPEGDADLDAPLAPGAESWREFVDRASGAVAGLADRHRGQTVVVATHAGVIESTVLRLLPVDRAVGRLGLHPGHASLTVWERADGRWVLERYNDRTPGPTA
jgi:probable phosphoglycerate mutase